MEKCIGRFGNGVTHYFCPYCGKHVELHHKSEIEAKGVGDYLIFSDFESEHEAPPDLALSTSYIIYDKPDIFCVDCNEFMETIDSAMIDNILDAYSIGMKTVGCCSGHVNAYDGLKEICKKFNLEPITEIESTDRNTISTSYISFTYDEDIWSALANIALSNKYEFGKCHENGIKFILLRETSRYGGLDENSNKLSEMAFAFDTRDLTEKDIESRLKIIYDCFRNIFKYLKESNNK